MTCVYVHISYYVIFVQPTRFFFVFRVSAFSSLLNSIRICCWDSYKYWIVFDKHVLFGYVKDKIYMATTITATEKKEERAIQCCRWGKQHRNKQINFQKGKKKKNKENNK